MHNWSVEINNVNAMSATLLMNGGAEQIRTFVGVVLIKKTMNGKSGNLGIYLKLPIINAEKWCLFVDCTNVRTKVYGA